MLSTVLSTQLSWHSEGQFNVQHVTVVFSPPLLKAGWERGSTVTDLWEMPFLLRI